MNETLNKEELLKLLDIDFFEKIQERLSAEFGIASVITDIDGNPLINPSNFSSFCKNYIRKSPEGFNNCKACDAIGGFSAKKFMKPVIYTCHAGLTDFAAPIIVGDKLVGCFLCGQILTNDLPEGHFEKISKKFNISKDGYDEALKNLNVLPFEKVEYFANFLFEISTKISNFSQYQSIGNAASKTLEDDLNNLFSILTEKEEEKGRFSQFLKKIKLLFSNISVDKKSIEHNIENLNNNFFYTSSKIKDFNNKFKGFKV